VFVPPDPSFVPGATTLRQAAALRTRADTSTAMVSLILRS
jgi:hypothetical protein